MTLGEIIKKYRDEHDMSMGAFAEKSGISKAYISLLEKNKHPKTGQPIAPSLSVIKQAAEGMNIDFDILFSKLDPDYNISVKNENVASKEAAPSSAAPLRIPVLGRVAAGVPIDMVEDIVDWEELPADMARHGEYFGLVIHGDSMEPKMSEGDVIIVRQQADIESGQIGIITVNGDDATCKRIMKYADGIMLLSTNPKYPPMQYTSKEMKDLPIRILGKVVELRAKFE